MKMPKKQDEALQAIADQLAEISETLKELLELYEAQARGDI